MSSSTGGRLERLTAFLTRNDRFFTPRMLASIGVYLVVAASYVQARITDDGLLYYNFMRRLVGEDVQAYAYQFGVVFWNLPFYVLSRILRSANNDDWIDHVLIGALAVTVASTAAVIAIFYVSWRLIRELGLRGGPGAILLTVFGSPLFYYAIFQPGLKHAFDTLLVSVLALLLLHSTTRGPSTGVTVAIGLVIAFLISVRYANAVMLIGVIYILVRQRSLSHAYVAALAATVGATAILSLPFVVGIPYGVPPSERPASPRSVTTSVGVAPSSLLPPNQNSFRLAAPAPGETIASQLSGVDDPSSFEIDFLAPAKMLFTIKRGLFVWTPLTFFGVLGYLLFLRRERRHRVFLIGLGLSALALLLVHVLWGPMWFGGFSFSQRFLTALFPVFVIGIAELLARTRMLIAPVLIACVAWTAFLAVHHFYGYDFVSDKDGADRIVELYRTGEESNDSFWDERVTGPISRHWRAYLDWVGL